MAKKAKKDSKSKKSSPKSKKKDKKSTKVKTKVSDLPTTLQNSPKKAQRTYIKTHDAAVESYGEGERAHRAAFASLKHSFEKVGDHWEKKDKKGPSDKQAARKGRTEGRTAEGVDANASKAHLMDVAKRLDVSGRSRMTKPELVDAIKKANRRESARARRG